MIRIKNPLRHLGLGLTGVMLLGCGAGTRSSPVPRAAAACPEPVPGDQPSRFGSVFIDDRRIATNVAVRRTNAFPEAYELIGPEPPELAALPVDRIDLVQYLRGSDAEQSYALCPGTVAILFATKRARGS